MVVGKVENNAASETNKRWIMPKKYGAGLRAAWACCADS